MKIVVLGNPVDGLHFYGPFNNDKAAIEWAEAQGELDYWLGHLFVPKGVKSEDLTFIDETDELLSATEVSSTISDYRHQANVDAPQPAQVNAAHLQNALRVGENLAQGQIQPAPSPLAMYRGYRAYHPANAQPQPIPVAPPLDAPQVLPHPNPAEVWAEDLQVAIDQIRAAAPHPEARSTAGAPTGRIRIR